jgi:4-hydroxy-tetrahydrodipicolinate reductase
MVKIAVSGAAGKMGGRIINLAAKDSDFKLVVALERQGHQSIGREICGIKITDDPDAVKVADCLLEFTTPQATVEHLGFALKYKKPIVIGTTGLSSDDKFKIGEASKVIPIVLSPNMSIGINILFGLIKFTLEKLPGDYSVNITEAHHVHKKDAPSGTAKRIAEIIEATGRQIKDIKSIREGEIVGDHKVGFESPVEKIELSHSATTRDIFAQGALKATGWITNKQAGLYSMEDVLKNV